MKDWKGITWAQFALKCPSGSIEGENSELLSSLDRPGSAKMPNVGTSCKQEISQVIILPANYHQCSSLQRKEPLQS